MCEILEQNAVMAKNARGGDEKWVVASWLRDHLLMPRERTDAKLWKEVVSRHNLFLAVIEAYFVICYFLLWSRLKS